MIEWDDIRCPVRLPAEEGRYSRRCDYHTGCDGICPQHGNVTEFMKRYKKTRQLVDEGEVVKKPVKLPTLERSWWRQLIYDVLKKS